MAVTCEPGTATYEQVLGQGRIISSGYLDGPPGVYSELWGFEGYVYVVQLTADGPRVRPFGLLF